MRPLPVLALSHSVLFVSCVTRPFPVHGGGKRFYQEQEALRRAIQGALDNLDFHALDDRTVRVEIRSVGDAGGGTEAHAGGFNPLGIFSGATVLSAGSQGIAGAGVGATLAPPRSEVASEVFANSEDIEYLKGEVIRRVHMAGGRVGVSYGRGEVAPTVADALDGILYVQVGNLGLAKSDLDVLLYSQKELECRVQVTAFLVGLGARKKETALDLKGATGACRYMENFLLGIGPLNRGQSASNNEKL